MNMYHMGFHLEAQRQQRNIDKTKAAKEKTAPPQVTASQRQETRSGTRPATRMATAAPCSRANNITQSNAKPQTATVLGYQRIGQPTVGQRASSRPDQYQDRWLSDRFRIRHDRNLVPLPHRNVDITHQ